MAQPLAHQEILSKYFSELGNSFELFNSITPNSQDCMQAQPRLMGTQISEWFWILSQGYILHLLFHIYLVEWQRN